MVKRFSVPRGTCDILPENVMVWQDIETKARQILHTYGYKEIRTPIFEETELFARSMGQTSDVVQKQMLSLQSQKKSDEQDLDAGGLSLRPEGTASIVRSYIENSFDKKENLSKLFYLGPMFRGERPQKGRLRQFHQIGAEAIGPGSASPYLDAEIISLCVNILKSFGLNNFKLKINTLGSAQDKESFSKKLRDAIKPQVTALCEDCRQRFERNVFRILDCKNESCKNIIRKVNISDDYLSAESKEYYVLVKEALKNLNIEFIESPHLVRGLDYYTHTVFEISDSSLGSQDALGAGGRYNNLVTQLDGPEVDAIGFALGIERILLAKSKDPMPAPRKLDAFIVALDEKSLKEAFQILNFIRLAGVSSDMSFKLSSMKSQMRLADKLGAQSVIILGENELSRECVTLKNMQTGNQEEVSINNKDYNQLSKLLLERHS